MSETSTGDTSTRLFKPRVAMVLGWATLASLVVLALFGLWGAPPDKVQSDAQRLMYLHVPTAWVAYLAFGVTALASALWLWPRTRSTVWDRVAGSSAELGVIFTALCLVLGSLWGRPVWGVWWAWDARLVTTAVLFFLYLGYLALRRIPASPDTRAKRCAIAALIAFVDVPIVHFSVTWWRTLHQDGTVFNSDLSAHIHGVMAFTLWFGVFAFTLLYASLLDRRYRLMVLDEDREDREVAQAIRERVGAVAGSRRRRHRPPSRWERSSEVRGVRRHGLGAHRRGPRRVLAVDRAPHQARRGVLAGCARGRRRVTTGLAPPPTRRGRSRPRRADGAGTCVAVGGCVVAIVAIVLLAIELSGNVVYFRTVSEAVHQRQELGTDRFRLAGAVVPGTIHDDRARRALRRDRRQGDRLGRPHRGPARSVQA